MTEGTLPPTGRPASAALLLAGLLAALAWVFWPTLTTLASRWSVDPQYTHGYVVPVFAAIVLWFRRASFPGVARPSWWGVLLLAAASGMRLAGSAFSFEWLEAGALLPALAGVCLLAVGPAATRWAWPAAAFLLFVLPWPWQFDQMLTYPLRRVATLCSTYLLQTLGQPALARGNIIVINDLEVGVVEACSGLGMLMTFFALSTAVALVMRRPLLDRVVLFLSAIPVGVLMNIARITVTVWLYQVADADTARWIFHDVAGWVMMPAALGVMWVETWFLGRLWLAERTRPLPVPVPSANVPPPPEPPRWAARRAGEKRLVSRPDEAELPLQEIPDAAP